MCHLYDITTSYAFLTSGSADPLELVCSIPSGGHIVAAQRHVDTVLKHGEAARSSVPSFGYAVYVFRSERLSARAEGYPQSFSQVLLVPISGVAFSPAID